MEGILKETEVASRAVGVELELFKAAAPNEIESAFSGITSSSTTLADYSRPGIPESDFQ
jgi:hypothetical protein